MSEQFLGSIPMLPVVSVIETARFFEKKLGFTIRLLWQNPSYAVVGRGDVLIEFGERRKKYAGCGVCLIKVENADVVYEEWASREVEFVGDFAVRDYGSKDFRVKDNNGNLLIISSDMENKNELIAKGNIV